KGLAIGQQLVQEQPKDPFIHAILGKIYFKQKKYRDAAISSARAMELGMDNPMLRNGLGISYLYLNENDKALQALEPFETRNIPFAIGHYNLACAYARKGQ